VSEPKCPNCLIYLRVEGALRQCSECGFNYIPSRRMMDDIYAWLSVDPSTGMEGFIASQMSNGVAMVLLHSQEEVAMRLRPMAEAACRVNGFGVRLARYRRDGDVLEVKPRGQ
jgi:hypothetical protein